MLILGLLITSEPKPAPTRDLNGPVRLPVAEVANPAVYVPPVFTDPVPRTVLEHGKATRKAPAIFHSWSLDDGDPKTYRAGPVTLTVASAEMKTYNGYPDPWGLMLKVSAPGLKTRTLNLSEKSWTEFAVGRFDPARPEPQVMFATYSGGRSCCYRYYLLTPGKGVWRLEKLGHWNQFDSDERPRDRDGDGAPEFQMLDDAFFEYPKADFDQWPPPRFIQVENGKPADVSHRPGFAAYFREHVRRTLPACRRHDNYACSALVAAAARIGRKDWAWKVMLKNHDPDGPRPWVDCLSREFSEACATPETLYPVALKARLVREGYWPETAGTRDAMW